MSDVESRGSTSDVVKVSGVSSPELEGALSSLPPQAAATSQHEDENGKGQTVPGHGGSLRCGRASNCRSTPCDPCPGGSRGNATATTWLESHQRFRQKPPTLNGEEAP